MNDQSVGRHEFPAAGTAGHMLWRGNGASGIGGLGNRCFPYRRLQGCQESSTAVRLRVAQFDSRQKPLVAFGCVSLEVIEQSEKRPFVALVREAKAAARIAVSISLN